MGELQIQRPWMGTVISTVKTGKLLLLLSLNSSGGFFQFGQLLKISILSFVFQFSQGAKAAVYNMMSDMYGYIG